MGLLNALNPLNVIDTTLNVISKPIEQTVKPALEFSVDTLFKPISGDFSAYTYGNFREHLFDTATFGYWDEIKQEFKDSYSARLEALSDPLMNVEGYSIDDYKELMRKGGSLASYRGENVIEKEWGIDKKKVSLKDLATSNIDLFNITDEDIEQSLISFSERLESIRQKQLSPGYGALL